ncbi:tetratricopeptide repeat protein [Prevotella intermedia]|uniref:tetratricopeptide repeat protein n=1 Tax=Prevotella intermedia TaxID=28131 RepID=UPI0018E075BC|nr:tetratricopeptide repeat protein [Prevotella intermedia]
MNKVFITILLLGISFTLSAQNTTAEQEALYYIKKAYQHRSDADKTAALKYLKVFEEYLSARLKPEDVGDSISIYYARTVATITVDIDSIASGSSSINMQKAYDFSIRPAEKGNRECQNIVGDFLYQQGDYSKAVKWYQKAAEQEYAPAQTNLGGMYEGGYGVSKDYSEAVKWFRKAAEHGFASAQNALGWKYACGYGVPKDYHEAVKWFRKAAEQDYVPALNNLGWSYYNGYGVSQDYSEAVKWFRKAAEQDYGLSQNNLGCMYYNGDAVSQDYSEAVKLFRKAADQGYDKAQTNLGWMYENGYGVSKNHSEAVKWYRKAAEQGNKIAQVVLKELGEIW